MKTDIQRYEASLGVELDDFDIHYNENPIGEWVKYDDHVAIVQALQSPPESSLSDEQIRTFAIENQLAYVYPITPDRLMTDYGDADGEIMDFARAIEAAVLRGGGIYDHYEE